MDMKMEDRRATPRFRVQFRTTVSDPTQPEGTGLMLDLSRSGGLLESPFLFLPGLSLELRIYVPGLEWPLMIDGADVQWVSEQTAGLAFVRIREAEQQRLDEVLTARLAGKSEDGDTEQFEAVPFEFQELEKVLSKDPQLAISKGLSWFAQDREQFRFRGGSLLSRALPNCSPEVAAALADLVKAGGDMETDFSLALLQNYPGETSTYVVLKEIVSRFPHDDRKMSGVRISIDSTGVVSGEFGLADAWQVKQESLRPWLTDERQAVKAFAEQHIAELDRMIAAERHRVEAERAMRNRSNDDAEPGAYRAKPF
ncbi:MAG: PilZ domain-containing protein [Nitrospira sp.]